MSYTGRKQRKPSLSSSSSSSTSDTSDDQPRLIKGSKPSSDRDSLFDEDSDNSDSSNFIVEDDGVTPALLPTQFSMEAHQDLSHQFKKIFQFFVHIAVRPAKERHDFMEKQIQGDLSHGTLPSNLISILQTRNIFLCLSR
jgi:Domain of unknown function (DUF4211)